MNRLAAKLAAARHEFEQAEVIALQTAAELAKLQLLAAVVVAGEPHYNGSAVMSADDATTASQQDDLSSHECGSENRGDIAALGKESADEVVGAGAHDAMVESQMVGQDDRVLRALRAQCRELEAAVADAEAGKGFEETLAAERDRDDVVARIHAVVTSESTKQLSDELCAVRGAWMELFGDEEFDIDELRMCYTGRRASGRRNAKCVRVAGFNTGLGGSGGQGRWWWSVVGGSVLLKHLRRHACRLLTCSQ